MFFKNIYQYDKNKSKNKWHGDEKYTRLGCIFPHIHSCVGSHQLWVGGIIHPYHGDTPPVLLGSSTRNYTSEGTDTSFQSSFRGVTLRGSL